MKINQSITNLLFRYLILVCLTLPLAGDSTDLFTLTDDQHGKLNKETVLALDYLRSYHYTKKDLDNIESKEILINFMKELDYNRLFFQKKDRDEILVRFEKTLKEVYLSDGDLYPAFQIFSMYRDRVHERINWVFKKLKGDFNFKSDQTFIPDRSEMDWPENTKESNRLWSKRIKHDLLQEMLTDLPLKDAIKKVHRRYTRTKKYVDEIEAHNVHEIFLTTFAHLFDPHSNFLSSDSLEEFSISMRNSLFGIGALLRDEDGYCVIQKLIPGGPAEMSGQLYPGDKIVEVSQKNEAPVDVIDMKLRKIVKQIRGKKGTEVILTIVPSGSSDTSDRKVVKLIRDKIKLTSNLTRAEVYEIPFQDSTIQIGVIDVPSFYGSGSDGKGISSTTNDVEELIEKLKKIGVKGLILDLRKNGGGLLSEAVSLTGLFIPKGPVVQIKDTTGNIRQDWDRNPKVAYTGPLVVLVSRRSASASEIVAGALQNHKRAIIVGDSATHGKGTVQAIFELDRNLVWNPFTKKAKFGAAKITIQKFYLPNGASTQKEGVQSDIILPSINEYLPIGESDLPNALVWDTIEPIKWEEQDSIAPGGAQIENHLIDELRAFSGERQSKLKEFSYVQSNINWFKKRQELKEVSLNIKKRKTQKEADKLFKKEMDELRYNLSLTDFFAKEVLLDISIKQEKQHQEKLKKSLLPNGKPLANNYYQKVFYYQPNEESEVSEVWVEEIDYEAISKYNKKIKSLISKKIGIEVNDEVVEELLQDLKTLKYNSNLQVENIFMNHFGNIVLMENINEFLPEFFTQLIELDPRVLNKRDDVDILLRESLRIVSDWLIISTQTAKTLNSNQIETKQG